MKRALLLLPFLFFTGCSPSEPEKPSPAQPVTTIVFRHGRVSGFEAFFSSLLSRFSRENPGLAVKDENMPWEPDQQHQLYAINLEGKSDAFDVMGLDVIWVSEFARAGWALDLSPYFSEEERRKFISGTIEAATYDGKIYAVPWFTDAGLLYYRKDLLEKHNLPVPKTWPELAQTAQAVLSKEKDPALTGFVWQGKQYEGLVCNVLEYLHSRRLRVLDAQGRWTLDVGKAAEVLDFMKDLISRKASPLLVLTADEETTRHIFGNGQAVFLRNWPYALALFDKPDSPVKGKFGIAPLPRFPGGESSPTLGGWFLAVNSRSKHPREAYELIRYLNSPEVQKSMFEMVGYLPTRRGLYRDPELLKNHPYLSSMRVILETARPRPVTPFYVGLSSILQAEFSAALSRIKTSEQALKDIEIQVQPLLEKGGRRKSAGDEESRR